MIRTVHYLVTWLYGFLDRMSSQFSCLTCRANSCVSPPSSLMLSSATFNPTSTESTIIVNVERALACSPARGRAHGPSRTGAVPPVFLAVFTLTLHLFCMVLYEV
jgi:hypothetical protein